VLSQTINRAISIVEFVSERARTLNEIASHLEVHRSTALRQLQTLEGGRFVLRRSDGRFAVGTRLIAIAQQALEGLDLRQIAAPHLRTLQGQVGHTVHMAQLMGDEIIYIDKVEGTDSVRMYSRVGMPASPQASAVGKVILAQLLPGRREALLRNVDWVAHTQNGHASVDTLTADLDRITQQGWGQDDGEFEKFVNCIAAPVSNSTGDIVAGISITSIKVIASLNDLGKFMPSLQQTAQAIRRELG
jgi:DNA-binding IclR family transcriptional regulator